MVAAQMGSPSNSTVSIDKLPRRRRWFDGFTHGLMALGAAAAVAAIVLMLTFLAQVAAPLLRPAAIGPGAALALPSGQAKLLQVSANGQAALRVDASGKASIFAADTGEELQSLQLGAPVIAAKPVFLSNDLYAVLDAAQRIWLLQANQRTQLQAGVRRLHPELRILFGGRPIEAGALLDYDAVRQADGALTLALLSSATATGQCATAAEGRASPRHGENGGAQPRRIPAAAHPCAEAAAGSTHLEIRTFPSSLAAAELDQADAWRQPAANGLQRLWFGPQGRWLYTLGADGLAVWSRAGATGAERRAWRPSAAKQLANLADHSIVTPLIGRQSLLIPHSSGLAQWSLFRVGGRAELAPVRSFALDAAPRAIVAERRRKGFAVLDEAHNLYLAHATSDRILAKRKVEFAPGTALALAPRGDLLLALAPSGKLQRLSLTNEHPEVSWSALFAEVQYESYPAPVHSWQSTSASADFEPKFSLTPLLFGTLKAAFYAMLFAAPVAVMGALYTACFMAPAMRRWVKPAIEMMAALPTVVLGFLAGLWLAPLVEANLAAVAALLLFLPGGMALFAGAWRLLGEDLKRRCEGWQALIAIVPLAGLAVATIQLAPALEAIWLGGDAKAWLLESYGLGYDQRNALVVGLAMGVAVIPLIFTIAEDALHAVPRHLADASLALGATHWQTVTRVILLTASPGIFSALMIGLGRAVGETMIVLMAAGNTPIMDFGIFAGMRTLAANIAVELPESAVGSTHYRLLFLSALMLFAMTFAFNTVGDLVRERLRSRFGSL